MANRENIFNDWSLPKYTWLIFIRNKLFFLVENIGTPFMFYATPKTIVEEKNANIFWTKYQTTKMYLKRKMLTYYHNNDHTSVQLHYKKAWNHHLDPFTIYHKMSCWTTNPYRQKYFQKIHTMLKITCKCINFFLKKNMGLFTCVNYHGLIKIIVNIYYPLLLISKPLEQFNQIKLFTNFFERCLQSCTYKRRWWVENNISHKVWPFWIQCHVFWFY